MTSMSELRKKVFEDTGVDMLSPINIARDRRLRKLYDAWQAAKNTPEEEAAWKAFEDFIRKEYP